MTNNSKQNVENKKERRGAPVGNRNAVKHGKSTARAISERQSERAFFKDMEDLLQKIMEM